MKEISCMMQHSADIGQQFKINTDALKSKALTGQQLRICCNHPENGPSMGSLGGKWQLVRSLRPNSGNNGCLDTCQGRCFCCVSLDHADIWHPAVNCTVFRLWKGTMSRVEVTLCLESDQAPKENCGSYRLSPLWPGQALKGGLSE